MTDDAPRDQDEVDPGEAVDPGEVDPYDLVAVSARNRADPVAMLQKFLRGFWQDNLPDEALTLWKRQVAGGRWYAEDVLYALRAVLAAPPHNLADLLREDGWVLLDGQDPEEWLAATIDRMQTVMGEGREYQ